MTFDRPGGLWGVGVLILISALGLGFRRQIVQTGSGKHVLDVPKESLDLRTLWIGQDHHWELPLRNMTGKVLVIEKLSAPHTRVLMPLPIQIPPRASCSLALATDIRTLCQGTQGRSLIPFNIPIRTTVAGRKKSIDWEGRGIARIPWTASPAALEIRDVLAGSVPPPLSLEIAGAPEVSMFRVGCDFNLVADLALTPLSSKPCKQRLTVKLRPQEKPGQYVSKIIVKAMDNEGALIPDGEIPFLMTVVGPVKATPESLNLGSVRSSAPETTTVVLESRLSESFRVVSVWSSDDVLAVSAVSERFTPKEGKRQNIPLEIIPRRTGAQNGKIAISVKFEQGSSTTFELPVTYLGTTPLK
ncbi:MAG: hypothetical protein U0903_03690 [Planctomycetales bacterium]